MGRDGWFDRILRWGSADDPARSSGAGQSAHSTEFELLGALERPVCAVCDRTRRAGERYVAGVVREGVNDPETRDAWRRRGGLCARHWGAFRSQESSPLPAAIVAEDLLATYLEDGPPELACPACEIEAIAQRRYLQACERLAPDAVDKALERGRGFLCVHHLEGLRPGAVRERFRRRLHEVLADLATFRRKQDYRFAHEPAGDERDAWLRAMRALGGDV